MKPRLLCLMQLPPPVHGASAMNELVAKSHYLAMRFELDVLPLRFAESIADIGRISPRKLARAAGTAARIARSLAVRRPDAVYLTLAPSGPAFVRDCLFIAVARAFGVPRIYHLHGKGIAPRLATTWNRALYAWAFSDAHVIQLSEQLASDLDALVAADRVHAVPNGIPDTGAPRTRGHDGPPRVLYLSNLIESKGPLVLLDALAELAARGVSFVATYAGARFDDACLREFRARIERFGLAERIHYVGPVYGDAKQQLLRDHDVLAFPSHNDTFPLVVLEAMCAGLPVVSTFEGCIPEIVDDGVTGRLVPPRDPHALADVLEPLLAKSELRSCMGERGRARYLERFTVAHFERRLGEVLARCVVER